MVLMSKVTLPGHCWINLNGTKASPKDLGFITLTSKTRTNHGTQRHLLTTIKRLSVQMDSQIQERWKTGIGRPWTPALPHTNTSLQIPWLLTWKWWQRLFFQQFSHSAYSSVLSSSYSTFETTAKINVCTHLIFPKGLSCNCFIWVAKIYHRCLFLYPCNEILFINSPRAFIVFLFNSQNIFLFLPKSKIPSLSTLLSTDSK